MAMVNARLKSQNLGYPRRPPRAAPEVAASFRHCRSMPAWVRTGVTPGPVRLLQRQAPRRVLL
jgi:hypothetical protein